MHVCGGGREKEPGMVPISSPQPSVVFKEVVVELELALFHSTLMTSWFFPQGTELRCVSRQEYRAEIRLFVLQIRAFFKVPMLKPCYYGSCPAKASVAFLCLLASPEGSVAAKN